MTPPKKSRKPFSNELGCPRSMRADPQEGAPRRKDRFGLRALGSSSRRLCCRDLVEAYGDDAGEPFLYPGAVKALIRSHFERAKAGDSIRDDPLSPRESKVTKLIAEGDTSREIEETL